MKHLIIMLVALCSFTLVAQNNTHRQPNVIPLSESNFDREVASGFVLVEFWATWCKSCTKMESVLKEISTEQDLKVGKVNIDQEPKIKKDFKVKALPTIVLMKDGIEVDRIFGECSKERLLQLLKRHMK